MVHRRAIPQSAVLAVAMALSMVPALSRPCRAQTGSAANDKVAAEALFEEGRKLLAAGKYADACPKFSDSERLDPSPGTLLNLANCWEKVGKTATAWVTYKEAASSANALGRADYVTTAQRHADALAPRLARLTLSVAQPVDGLQVKRDGVVLSSAQWGAAIPVDPGSHTVEALAPGHRPWVTAVAAQDGSQVSVSVPALEALPAEAPPPPSAPPPPAAPTAAPPPAAVMSAPPEGEAASTGSGQRTLGLVVGGVGAAGLLAGAAFALVAKNKYNDSLANCHVTDPNVCNATGVSQRDDARSKGDIASVAAGLGAAALVAGGVLWLTAPRARATVAVVPTFGGASIEGAW